MSRSRSASLPDSIWAASDQRSEHLWSQTVLSLLKLTIARIDNIRLLAGLCSISLGASSNTLKHLALAVASFCSAAVAAFFSVYLICGQVLLSISTWIIDALLRSNGRSRKAWQLPLLFASLVVAIGPVSAAPSGYDGSSSSYFMSMAAAAAATGAAVGAAAAANQAPEKPLRSSKRCE